MTRAKVQNSAHPRRLSRCGVFACALLVLVCARVSSATQVIPLTLEQMVRGSSDIVVASIISAQSRWGDATKRWMLTDYTIEVEQVVVGNVRSGGRITVTFWGGTINGETQRIAGMHLPSVGRRHLLMLGRD